MSFRRNLLTQIWMFLLEIQAHAGVLTVPIFRKLRRRSSELWMWRNEPWTRPTRMCTLTYGTNTLNTIQETSQRMVARAIKTQREERQKLPEPGWRRWKRTIVSKLLDILKMPRWHHAASLAGLSWFISSCVFQRHRSIFFTSVCRLRMGWSKTVGQQHDGSEEHSSPPPQPRPRLRQETAGWIQTGPPNPSEWKFSSSRRMPCSSELCRSGPLCHS